MSNNSPAALLAYQKAHYHENRSPELLAGCIVSIVFVVIGILMRFWAQSTIGKTFVVDSWLILIAAAIAIATTACVITAVANGLGKHELRVETADPNPPGRTAFIFEMGYVVTVLQAVALMFTKLSILLFYRRVFTTRVKAQKWAIWILFAYCLALGIGSTIEFILACNPPDLFWLRVYPILGYKPPKLLKGTCEPQTLHLAIPLIADLISEVALLAIPAIALWNLQMPLKKKLGVYFAFSLGIFVTAISIVRFVFAFQLENDGDLSWDDSNSFLWTAIQVCFGVVAACVPAMAPLYRSFKAYQTQKGSHGTAGSRNRGISKFSLLSRSKNSIDTESVKNFAAQSSEVHDRPWEPKPTMNTTIKGNKNGAPNHVPLTDLSRIRVSKDIRMKVSPI